MGLEQLILVCSGGGCVYLPNQVMSEAFSVLNKCQLLLDGGTSESFKGKFSGQLLTLSELLALCPSMCEMFVLV